MFAENMDKPVITSLSNPFVKHARALRQKKARAESGSFLVEGIHHVGEALEAGWQVESVLMRQTCSQAILQAI